MWGVSPPLAQRRVVAQGTSNGEIPFAITCVEGKCANCRIRWDLGPTQFTSRNNGWAVADSWPATGGQGFGERVILHTSDGGRTWIEVRGTDGYGASPPSAIFPSARVGWLLSYKQPLGEQTVLETHDGGVTWRDVTAQFPSFPGIIDEKHWYRIEGAQFVRTADGGATWTRARIPNLVEYNSVDFISPEIGWIFAMEGNYLIVFGTTDGGDSWTESRTSVPKGPTNIRDVFFINKERGWLIIWNSGERSYLLSTIDGGRTWTRASGVLFEEDLDLMKSVAFLSPHIGFVFMDEAERARTVRSAEPGWTIHSLAYTWDGGSHWQKLDLPYSVSGCQVMEGDLICSASSRSAGLVTLTLHPKR